MSTYYIDENGIHYARPAFVGPIMPGEKRSAKQKSLSQMREKKAPGKPGRPPKSPDQKKEPYKRKSGPANTFKEFLTNESLGRPKNPPIKNIGSAMGGSDIRAMREVTPKQKPSQLYKKVFTKPGSNPSSSSTSTLPISAPQVRAKIIEPSSTETGFSPVRQVAAAEKKYSDEEIIADMRKAYKEIVAADRFDTAPSITKLKNQMKIKISTGEMHRIIDKLKSMRLMDTYAAHHKEKDENSIVLKTRRVVQGGNDDKIGSNDISMGDTYLNYVRFRNEDGTPIV